MKYEVECDNRSCPSNITLAIMGDSEEVFHHVMLSSSDDRCPACGSTGVRVVATVPDEHRFALGAIVKTPSIDTVFGEEAENVAVKLLARHVRGDWGDVSRESVTLNNNAIGNDARPQDRFRVLSVYNIDKETVWIITERGRHQTTVMLPSDY